MNTRNRFPLRSGQHLYFVENPITGLVKVGSTKDVERRVRELECASGMTLEILRVCEDDGHMEQEVHDALAAYRRVGEWFDPPLELLDFCHFGKSLEWLLMEVEGGYDDECEAENRSEGASAG